MADAKNDDGCDGCDPDMLCVCKSFNKLSMPGKEPPKGGEYKMTNKAMARMMKDCGMSKDVSLMESSCFPTCQDAKKQVDMQKDGTKVFKKLADVKTKAKKKGATADEIEAEFQKMKKCIIDGAPKLAEAKTNKQAEACNARMTDSKNYTGSHQSRFGEDGKGKGIEGRTDKGDGTGYVTGSKLKPK